MQTVFNYKDDKGELHQVLGIDLGGSGFTTLFRAIPSNLVLEFMRYAGKAGEGDAVVPELCREPYFAIKFANRAVLQTFIRALVTLDLSADKDSNVTILRKPNGDSPDEPA